MDTRFLLAVFYDQSHLRICQKHQTVNKHRSSQYNYWTCTAVYLYDWIYFYPLQTKSIKQGLFQPIKQQWKEHKSVGVSFSLCGLFRTSSSTQNLSFSPCLYFCFFVIHLHIFARQTPTEPQIQCISITIHTFHLQPCTLYLPAVMYLSAALAPSFHVVFWACAVGCHYCWLCVMSVVFSLPSGGLEQRLRDCWMLSFGLTWCFLLPCCRGTIKVIRAWGEPQHPTHSNRLSFLSHGLWPRALTATWTDWHCNGVKFIAQH